MLLLMSGAHPERLMSTCERPSYESYAISQLVYCMKSKDLSDVQWKQTSKRQWPIIPTSPNRLSSKGFILDLVEKNPRPAAEQQGKAQISVWRILSPSISIDVIWEPELKLWALQVTDTIR